MSKNSSFQVVCENEEERCFGAYQRLNSSLEGFGMECHSAQFCKALPQICQELVTSDENECCEGSCCDSTFATNCGIQVSKQFNMLQKMMSKGTLF